MGESMLVGAPGAPFSTWLATLLGAFSPVRVVSLAQSFMLLKRGKLVVDVCFLVLVVAC